MPSINVENEREFDSVSRVNLERCNVWHPGGLEEWSVAMWAVALAGECGEFCNIVKKLNREETGVSQASGVTKEELLRDAAHELADTFLYLDLNAQRLGLNLFDCIKEKFNITSEKEGLPQRIGGDV